MDLPRPCIVEVTQIVPPADVPMVAARVAERLAMPVERVQKLIDGRTGPITRPLRPDKAEAIAQTFEAAGVVVSIRLATEDDEPEAATSGAAAGAEAGAGAEPGAAAAPAPASHATPDVPPPDPPPDPPPASPPEQPPEQDDREPADAPGRDPEPEPAELPRRDTDADAGDDAGGDERPPGPASFETPPFDTPPGRTATRSAAGRAAAPARGGAPLRIEPDDDEDEEPGEAGHPARGEVPPRRRPLVVEYGAAHDDAGGDRRGARRQDPSSGVIPVLGRGTHPTFTDEDTWGSETDAEGAWIIRPSTERRVDGTDDGDDPDARRGSYRDVADRGDAELDETAAHADGIDAVDDRAPFDVDEPEERYDDLELPPLRSRDDDEPEVELDTDAGGDEAPGWRAPDPPGGAAAGGPAPAHDEASGDAEAPADDAATADASDARHEAPWSRTPAFEPEPGSALDDEEERVPIAWRGLGDDESGPARPPGARIPKRADAETLRAEEEAHRVVVRRTAMLWALVLAVVAFVLVQFWVAGRASDGYVDGLHRYRDAQFASARGVWTRLAEAGDPNAQFMLGYMSEAGLGQPWSARAAASWYRMAADAGHAEAQWRLGTLYERGLGVPWSVGDARRWWAAAAAGGHAEAAAALAHSHLVDGRAPDLATAHAAFTVAAALGRRDARVYLDLLSVASDDANARTVP